MTLTPQPKGATLFKFPFRKFVVVREELRVGSLSRNAEEANREHHYDLIGSIVDDYGIDDSDVTAGWLSGDISPLTLTFATPTREHRRVAVTLVTGWAEKEGLTVSFPSADAELTSPAL